MHTLDAAATPPRRRTTKGRTTDSFCLAGSPASKVLPPPRWPCPRSSRSFRPHGVVLAVLDHAVLVVRRGPSPAPPGPAPWREGRPTRSRSYLTGLFLLFSNSNVGSTAISLPLTLRKALVQRTFRGLRFRLKFYGTSSGREWELRGERTVDTRVVCDRYVIRTRNLQD